MSRGLAKARHTELDGYRLSLHERVDLGELSLALARLVCKPSTSRAGRREPWTVDDVLALPEDTGRIELVGGALLASASSDSRTNAPGP
ncbi:hypothetical protein F7Q99_30920 [Streptomyces kaniharaensis]|uniref:Uncharacterized protein n=1 Tax=Streptomyces kaniharaensis TaxID=212423 RepID=A0A6N7L0X9_9ACTN|nr:hypothetical protein [Streptomyces kaniharaensis]MQS16489.1 hypothetical protein [Streptomyces kaniharaensis]